MKPRHLGQRSFAEAIRGFRTPLAGGRFPVGLIGNGYSQSVKNICLGLLNETFFYRPQKICIKTRHAHSVRIRVYGRGLKPAWIDFCRAWRTENLFWSIVTTRDAYNRLSERNPRKSLLIEANELTDLMFLWALLPYSHSFCFTLRVGRVSYVQGFRRGMPSRGGEWRADTGEFSSTCLKLSVLMDSVFFPQEKFSASEIREIVFDQFSAHFPSTIFEIS